MTFEWSDDQKEIRRAVAALCARFGNDYWRSCDERNAYPDEFVRAMTEAGWLAALIGEPFRSTSTPVEMANDLSREGWHVLSDTNGLEWANRWSETPGRRTARYLEEKHLVVAERRDS